MTTPGMQTIMFLPLSSSSKTYREQCYEQCRYQTIEDRGLIETYHAICVDACQDNKKVEYTDDGFTNIGGFFSIVIVIVIFCIFLRLLVKLFDFIMD